MIKKRLLYVMAFYLILFLIIALLDMKNSHGLFRVCMNYNFVSPAQTGWAIGDMFCPNEAIIVFKSVVEMIRGIFSSWPVRYALLVFLSISHAGLYIIRGYI